MERQRVLVDFKGSPQFIAPALRTIKQYQGRWELLKEALVKKANEMGYRASPEIIISAYTTPMLRAMHLITGEYNELKLTADGEELVQSLERDGETEFKKGLASLLYTIDNHTAGMIDFLETQHYSPNTGVAKKRLAEQLRNMGIEGADVRSTRLNGWIAILSYLGLVKKSDGLYYLDKSQMQIVKNGETIPSLSEFEHTLLDCYARAKSSMEGAASVPIPSLRDCVTRHFERLWGPRFDDLLKVLIQSNVDLQFVPATHMEYKEGGIWIGDKYYFFLAIFRR